MIWSWIRARITTFADVGQFPDCQLLNLTFPERRHEKAIVWIIGTYVQYAWHHAEKENELGWDKFFGYLTFKYKERSESLGASVRIL